MGSELATSEPAAAAIFAEADAALGISLSTICWEGPEEALNDTINTQPALLTHSIAVLRTFQEKLPDFRPAFTAGHSLGEFSALVAAGAMSFLDALMLVRERGRCMKEAGAASPGGMAAVLGLDVEVVEAGCAQVSSEAEGGVWVANDNCPGQVVISGDSSALEAAMRHFEAAGAHKAIRLAVSIAAHSPLMLPAQRDFSKALEKTSISDPQLPIIGNVNAQGLDSAEQIREDLSAQLTANVRWTDSIRHMIDNGVTTFVELGSGNVLTGLVRRIDRSTKRINLDSSESLRALTA